MSHPLVFDQMIDYDAAQPGVTVSIKLSLSDASVTVQAKIDTGSTNCIFARHLGEQLGLSIEDGLPKRIRTATGSFLTYEHEVTLSILDYDFAVLVCFAKDETFQTNVLGRYGFLMRVQLGLIDYEGKLFLSPYGVTA